MSAASVDDATVIHLRMLAVDSRDVAGGMTELVNLPWVPDPEEDWHNHYYTFSKTLGVGALSEEVIDKQHFPRLNLSVPLSCAAFAGLTPTFTEQHVSGGELVGCLCYWVYAKLLESQHGRWGPLRALQVNVDTVVISQLMATFQSTGWVRNEATNESWVWTAPAQLSTAAWVWERIMVLFTIALAFLYNSAITAIIVRSMLTIGAPPLLQNCLPSPHCRMLTCFGFVFHLLQVLRSCSLSCSSLSDCIPL